MRLAEHIFPPGSDQPDFCMISNKIRQATEEPGTGGLLDQDTRNWPERGKGTFRRRRGFTLIELLVVLGIIAVVVAGVGLALRGGDDTVALGSSQRTMSSLLTAARAQAIMNGTNARLIIHIDRNEPDRYLRFAGIVRERREADGSAYSPPRWVPTNEGTRLPRGTYFVPGSGAPVPGDLFGGDWDSDSDAFSRYPGTMRLEFPRTPAGQDYAAEGSGPEWVYYEFGPSGSLTAGVATNHQIVLTVGRRTPGTPVFENPENVRGIIIRPIGAFHLVDERRTFYETN